MKALSARVVNGHLDVPDGTLEEGVTVTLLVPELGGEERLTESQKRELTQALAEADAGEGVDGWQFLSELPIR